MKNVLTFKNNWENHEYYVDGKRIEDLKRVQIGRKSYKVESAEVAEDVYDMGHHYKATSTHFYVREKVFGISLTFDLSRIVRERLVKAIYYKVSPPTH